MTAIDVVLITWPNHPARMEYVQRTWASLQKNLTASRHKLRFLCSSETEHDQDAEWCGGALEKFCKENGIKLNWAYGSASLGHGMNAAMACADADLVFMHQDDYELLHPLDISIGAAFMEQRQSVDMIRYGYPPQSLFGWQLVPFRDGWAAFDVIGPWPYGDEPHLQRSTFVDRFGWYTEHNGHASEMHMMRRLVMEHATIVAADKSYYGHFGSVSSVPKRLDTWGGRTSQR